MSIDAFISFPSTSEPRPAALRYNPPLKEAHFYITEQSSESFLAPEVGLVPRPLTSYTRKKCKRDQSGRCPLWRPPTTSLHATPLPYHKSFLSQIHPIHHLPTYSIPYTTPQIPLTSAYIPPTLRHISSIHYPAYPLTFPQYLPLALPMHQPAYSLTHPTYPLLHHLTHSLVSPLFPLTISYLRQDT